MMDTTVVALIEVKIKNRDTFLEYVKGHLPSIKQYGGSFLGEFKAFKPFNDSNLQGTSDIDLLVIQEWPSEEAFMKWWHSDEYKEWKSMRTTAADVKLTLSKKLEH